VGIYDFISGLVSPVANLIEHLLPSDVDKMQVKSELLKIQTAFAEKSLAYEQAVLDAQTKIIVAEAQADSWLTRSWRPITMLTFVFMILYTWIAPAFKLPVVQIPSDLWDLIKIGLGGYTVGRSVEKIVPTVMSAMKEKEKT